MIDFYKTEQKDIVFISDLLNENKIIASLYNAAKNYTKNGIHTTDDNFKAQKLYEKCGYSIIEYGKCTTGDGVNRMGYCYIKNLI